MIATGLLWYDDDTRRPLAAKIADAAQRFRERVGYEPTTCQLNPALAQQATAQREQPKRRSRKLAQEPVVEVPVRLEPSDSLRPNYFFVGVQQGDKLKRVRGWQSPDQIEDKPATRSGKARRAISAAAAKQAAPTKATRSTRQHTAPAASPALVAEVSPPVATASKSRAGTIPEPAVVKKAAVAEISAPVAAKMSRKQSKPRASAASVPTPSPKISAVAPTPEHAAEAPTRTRKMKNAATPATPATEISAPVAAKTTPSAPKSRAPQAADGAPAPKTPAVVPEQRASETPTRAHKSKTAATPATAPAPAPVAKPVVQPAARSRRPAATTTRPAATTTRPAATSGRASVAVAVSAGPAVAAQTSLWGDLPPATPSRKRKSA